MNINASINASTKNDIVQRTKELPSLCEGLPSADSYSNLLSIVVYLMDNICC